MSVRLRLVYDQVSDAILVPQRAVTELLGKQFVTVLDGANKASQRPVTLGDRIGELWIVTSGLAANERIIVDGFQKAPNGAVVLPTMISEVQLNKPPAPTSGVAQAPAGDAGAAKSAAKK
jgi:membrane fusion protein, multidrug efflux system